MFEGGGSITAGPPMGSAESVRAVIASLALVKGEDDARRIDLIRELESLKAAAAAAQARLAVAFAESHETSQAAAGVPARERGRGVAAQVALARRDSPHRGSRHLGFARAMVHELPHTMAHLTSGRVSEWRATILCRETAVLSVDDRREVDRRLAADLPSMGDAQVGRAARGLAAQLDPESVARRASKAAAERSVSLRPAPDTMCYFSGLLPVAQGLAAYAALDRRARELIAAGDARGRGQIMADTLVERVTGQTCAEAVPVEVNLVIPVGTLMGEGDPGELVGHGPVPGSTARALLTAAGDGWRGDLVAAAVHLSRRQSAAGCREHATAVSRRPQALPGPSRPDLSHPVVRRPDPACRPRRARGSGRSDQRPEQAGAVRGVQPGQGSTWMEC